MVKEQWNAGEWLFPISNLWFRESPSSYVEKRKGTARKTPENTYNRMSADYVLKVNGQLIRFVVKQRVIKGC